MNIRTPIIRALAAGALAAVLTVRAGADDLRNIKHGEAVPPCKLPALDGTTVDSEALKGTVLVYVCLSAEQKRSELAAAESQQVIKELGGEAVKLIHVTADVVQKAYFEKNRQEHEITASLAFDADRVFYGKLGLIAFPTTVIVNKEGKLDNVISLHGSDYKNLLDAHVRHALGKLSDKELEQRLAAKPSERASPRSAASAHRALARLMREKGQLEAAKAELLKGLELDADNRELQIDLAEVNLAAGDLDGADAALEKVLKAQPDHRRAKQLKGTSLFRRGKLDEAAAVLEEALTLNPSPEICHYYLGQIMEKKGEKDKALAHYREALARFVHDEPAAKPAAPAAAPAPAK